MAVAGRLSLRQLLRRQLLRRPASIASARASSSSSSKHGLLDRLRTRYPDVSASALPSLAVSFLILHELTAVIPLIGGFYALRSIGAGEGLVSWAESVAQEGAQEEADYQKSLAVRLRINVGGAIQDAQAKAEKVARHYGWFGYEKKSKDQSSSLAEGVSSLKRIESLKGDAANLVGSYLVVKALMPARIVISLYYAPAFSRLLIGRFGDMLKRTGEKAIASSAKS